MEQWSGQHLTALVVTVLVALVLVSGGRRQGRG